MKVLLVMLGGFLGAISRFFIGEWVFIWQGEVSFPFGTLIVNLFGSLLLGGLAASFINSSPRMYLFFGTGFIGSFTTFSTFSVEVFSMLENREYWIAFAYIMTSLLAGVLLALSSYKVTIWVKAKKGSLEI